MGNRVLSFALAFVVSLGFMGVSQGMAQEDIGPARDEDRPLIIAVSPWAPYKGKNLRGGGFAVELVAEAMRRAGYETAVVHAKWKRAYLGAQTGKYDIIPGLWYAKDRTKHLAFGDVIALNRLVAIRRFDYAFEYESLKSFEGHLVGVARGYAYPQAFQEADFFEKEPANSLEDNLRKLIFGRINLTLGDELVARFTANRLFKEAAQMIKYSKTAVEEKELHFAVSLKNPAHNLIVGQFNAALATMRQDGAYAHLKSEHGLN